MISDSLKRIAVDSNAILSAVAGKAALRVFVLPEIEFLTTHFNFLEVQEYIPHFSIKYQIEEQLLKWQIKMLPLRIFEAKYYQSHFLKAQKLLKDRDSDDAHLAALALKENVPIWSNDSDFEGFSLPIYTTAQLLKILET